MIQRHREIPSFVYDPSLVLYLPLWKRDGGTFISDDHYGHLATVTGASWGVQGRTFDGTDDVITIPNSTALQITGDITAVAWVKATADADATNRRIISKIDAVSTYVGEIETYRQGTAGGSAVLVMVRGNSSNSETTLVGVTPLATNTWFHVAVVALGTTWTIYLNGVLDKTDTITQAVASNTGNLGIGARASGGVPIPALIGEVWIYNRAFTLAEIQHNFLMTKWRYV